MFKSLVLGTLAAILFTGCSVRVGPSWHPRPHYRVPGGYAESCGAVRQRIAAQCSGNRTCMLGLWHRHQARMANEHGVRDHCGTWSQNFNNNWGRPHYRAPNRHPRPRHVNRRHAPRRRHR